MNNFFQLHVLASSLLVSRFHHIIFDETDELEVLFSERELLEILKLEYTHEEICQIRKLKNFHDLEDFLIKKIFTDRFLGHLQFFEIGEIIRIIDHYSYSQLNHSDMNFKGCEAVRCPVCNYKTFDNDPAFDICSICSWQYDTSNKDQMSLTNTDRDGKPLTEKKAKAYFNETGRSDGKTPSPFQMLIREIHDISQDTPNHKR